MNNQQDTSEATESISLDTLYDLLGHQRRRIAIACLDERGPLAFSDLAQEVARHEYDAPISEIPEDEVLRVHSSLWHVHIPKLSEADVIDYDQDRKVVTLATNADLIEQAVSLEDFRSGETA